jgi:hypothetical protein
MPSEERSSRIEGNPLQQEVSAGTMHLNLVSARVSRALVGVIAEHTVGQRGAMYVLSAPTMIAAGARDSSRRNVSTAQKRQQNSKVSFSHQHACGLKSALHRSRGDHANTQYWFRPPASSCSGPGRAIPRRSVCVCHRTYPVAFASVPLCA